jgi:hypothetical protein
MIYLHFDSLDRLMVMLAHNRKREVRAQRKLELSKDQLAICGTRCGIGFMEYLKTWKNIKWIHIAFAAAEHGRRDFLEWFDWLPFTTNFSPNILDGLASGGHLEIFKEALDKYVSWLGKRPSPFSDLFYDACCYAIRNGHIELVEWIISEYRIPINIARKCSTDAFKSKKLDVVKWVHAQQGDNFFNSIGTMWKATAETGNLEIVKYMHEHFADRMSQYGVENMITVCVKHGFIDILKYITTTAFSQFEWKSDEKMLVRASKRGHLECLKWLVAEVISWAWDPVSCVQAALENDHFHVVEWIFSVRPDAFANEDGEFEKLALSRRAFKWLVTHRVKLDGEVCLMNVKEEAVDLVSEFLDKFHDQSRPQKKRRRKVQEDEDEWNER